jgi:hypothetical protein
VTVSTLRPNSTVSNSGVAVTGAASLHAALSDDSDAGYAASIGASDSARVGFGDFTLPSGAVVKVASLRLRAARTSPGTSTLLTVIYIGTGISPYSFAIAGTSPATVSVPAAWDDIDFPTVTEGHIDAAEVVLGSNSPADSVRVYEAYLDVTYVEKPDLTINAPTGTIEDTNHPVVLWTPDLDSDGGAQTHYWVAIVADGDDPVTDPVIAGAVAVSPDSSWQVDESLPNGTYDCYVRIAQTINAVQHWSDWEKADFVIDVAPPGEPTLTLVPEPSTGRMRLDIESDTGAPTSTDRYEAQASYDGGATFSTIRTPEGFGLATPEGDAATLWDHEGGNGQEASYRVRALHGADGTYAVSTWAEEAGSWGPTSGQWLKHPLNPSLNAPVRIHTYGSSERAARQGRMHPLGRTTLVIASDTKAPWGGQIQFYCRDDAERAALDAVLDAPGGLPLLLQVAATDKRPDRWVILGNQGREYPIDKAYEEATIETFDWVEAARP